MVRFGLKNRLQLLSSHRMYATLRLYRLNPIFERDFIRLWNELIERLKERNLINSAVLHKESKITYISYLRWTHKDHMDEVLKAPEKEIKSILKKISECCNNTTVLHRMYPVSEKIYG